MPDGDFLDANATSSVLDQLKLYAKPDAVLGEEENIAIAQLPAQTPGAEANAYYFGHPRWMEGWLKYVHRYPQLRERWVAAAGEWDGKVVVDVGCGPGNLFASIGGHPKALIGVDIAKGSLRFAKELGYLPLLADAHDMPLQDAIADIVAVNGSIHHVEDMAGTMRECARLVKPGGYLVIDHDPQKSAWNFRGLGLALWNLRRPIYRMMKRGGHNAAEDEGEWAHRSEIHHRPGDGLTDELIRESIEPLGFEVKVYPHNHKVGAEALRGQMGEKPRQIRMGQLLSGINTDSPAAALSLMCVARRNC